MLEVYLQSLVTTNVFLGLQTIHLELPENGQKQPAMLTVRQRYNDRAVWSQNLCKCMHVCKTSCYFAPRKNYVYEPQGQCATRVLS